MSVRSFPVAVVCWEEADVDALRWLDDATLAEIGEALNETQFGTGLVARGRLVLLHR